MDSLINIATLLIVLSATLGWLNKVFIGLPHAIALLIMGLLSSFSVIAVSEFFPALLFTEKLAQAVRSIDFFETLMSGMLSFLLFAAALHVDVGKLHKYRAPIFLLASLGVVISTVIIGTGLWWFGSLLGVEIPLAWALVFGAVISPTDPVAVLSVLKTTNISKSLETKIAGESLFNDGSGVIAFTVLVAVAMNSSGYIIGENGHTLIKGGTVDALVVAGVFLREVVGAIVLGLSAGFTTFFMLKMIDDAAVETLLSIALVLGISVVATELHISAPIAVVVSGLVIGNWGINHAMSERTRSHLVPFWTMIDEILNSVLFLLIGLEVLVINFADMQWAALLIAIPIILVARLVSVMIPVNALRLTGYRFNKGAVRVMTWGGVRGGISVALALSIPVFEYKNLIVTITYGVVCFSIIVQGLTIKPLVDRLTRSESDLATDEDESATA